MTLQKHRKTRRGFSLAELLIVVAIIGVLAGIAFVFINPKDIDYVEYNRSAEAIATAVQNRLTEIRNTGDMSTLRALGEQLTGSESMTSMAESTDAEAKKGGYRYLFNYSKDASGTITKNTLMSYILPFGAIDPDIADGYFAVIFQSDTGMCQEVFYSPNEFETCTVDYLLTLRGNENADKRKKANVGYYLGEADDQEIAFANLPTPQLTITNYEELVLQIKIPKVKQLADKKLGLLISLTDKGGEAFSKEKLSLTQTAIYSTFPLGDSLTGVGKPVILSEPQNQEIVTDSTYTMILDTVKTCDTVDSNVALAKTPTDKFENWAMRSDATAREGDKDKPFQLGDNSVITVTVYCLYNENDKNYSQDFPVDPTFLPRSASLTFNGWFNNYNDKTVEIACGRHLQNLNNLTELRPNLESYLPEVTEKDGNYTYGDHNYGMAHAYTNGTSDGDPTVSSDDIDEKYDRKGYVKRIEKAKQINAIDFDNDGWKEKGQQILFTPVNLPKDFYYYGNYLTISHLKVDAPFYAGLFGYVYHVRLYDILLVNPSVKSQMTAHFSELYEMGVGALIGTSRDSSHINNCQVYMTQENGKYDPEKYRVTGECYVGGLIGFCEDEHIENCSASVYTGYQKDAKREDGSDISSRYVGGLIGCITGDSKLENCYAAGNLSGEYVGGLVGFIKEDSDPSGDDYRIESCYTAGHIEYATVEAAGILGRIYELAGNAKGAVSVYGNYCVVIYGTESGKTAVGTPNYRWDCKTKDGETVPIYGTFKGDGFEWISTDDMGFSDVYLTGRYGDDTFFAGAVFKNDNKNYYIAQKGIYYSNSPYFTALNDEVEDLLTKIQGDATSKNLSTDIANAKDKVFWLKKLETLEELKRMMEEIIYEVDNETGKDAEGIPYNEGGYGDYETKEIEVDGKKVTVEDTEKSKYTKDLYLVTKRAKIEQDEDTSEGTVKLTVVQAIHAIYNKKYPVTENGVTTEKTLDELNYGGSDSQFQDTNKYLNGDYSFMGFYNALKEAYNDLIDEKTDNDDAAKEKIKFLIGEDDGTNGGENRFYDSSFFYRTFYNRMLYRLFNKAKDYYQYGKTDNNGELIYRHFRSDLVEERFRETLCDLAMSNDGRDALLDQAKYDALDKVIKGLEDYKKIIAIWEKTDDKDSEGNPITHPMKGEAQTAKNDVKAAITAVTALRDGIKTCDVCSSELETLITAAEDALETLSKLFDSHKSSNQEKDPGDWDAVDTSGKKGDMRKLRDTIDYTYQKTVALCRATANSGVENALDELTVKLKETGADQKTLVDEFAKNIKTYLGDRWNNRDSGHNIENSEQLRNAARGYVNGIDTGKDEDRDGHLGFMYDYGNDHTNSKGVDENPYTNSKNPVADNSYVDKDNKIYNNVFPYHESAYTHYYPFPFVFGLEVEGDDIPTTYVLFHYGDWLTEDLWADEESIKVTNMLYEAYTDVKNAEQVMAELEKNKEKITTENTKDEITTLYNAVKTCVESVEKALAATDQKDALKSIGETIQGWIATGGDFEKISEAFKKEQDKETELTEIKNKFEELKTTLTNLVSEIDAVVGDNVAKDGE